MLTNSNKPQESVTGAKPKHAGGRPTKHDDDLLRKAKDYLESWKDLGDAVPMIVGLAIHCNISKDTVYAWMKDESKREFSDIARRVEQMQERYLAAGGLSNAFNANITKLLLSKHGYSDRQEIDHTTQGEKITRIERVVIDGANSKD